MRVGSTKNSDSLEAVARVELISVIRRKCERFATIGVALRVLIVNVITGI